MSVDQKIANHICNVVRRQVQNTFPDLYLFFVVHQENERAKAYIAERHYIKDHPANQILQNFLEDPTAQKILNNSTSQFCAIAHKNSSGFLGLLRNESYLALSFLNFDRFENEDDLRNHVHHISWHAISLYLKYVAHTRKRAKNKSNRTESDLHFTNNNHILRHSISSIQSNRENLLADIFSISIQTINGKDEALNSVFNQRIKSTLSAKKGFRAEQYPSPICIDTLEFLFQQTLETQKKHKNPVMASISMTEGFDQTYDNQSIQQWENFSIPAQRMAWAGHPPEAILGAALYTGENTHTQSIADMIAERTNTTPQTLTDFQGENPFTAEEANERLHKRLCTQTMLDLLEKAVHKKDYTILTEKASSQNAELLNGKVIGWCANALYAASNVLKHANFEEDDTAYYNAKTEFEKELESVSWNTLSKFSFLIFRYARRGALEDSENIKIIASSDECFITIYAALTIEEKGTRHIQTEEQEDYT